MLFCLLAVTGICLFVGTANGDTLTTDHSASWRILGAASGSLSSAANWKGTGYESMAFNGNSDLIYRKEGRKWFRFHSGHWELGFTKFRDSLWQKHADQLRFQLLWSREAGHGRHSVTVTGYTQLFDSYFYIYDPLTDQTIRQFRGTLFSPAELNAGYGFCKFLPEWGSLNVAIATLRLRNVPGPTHHSSSLFLEYGCSVQALVMHNLGSHADWYFAGRFFVNAAGKDNASMDIINRFTIKVWKCFQVRLESRAVYEPVYSYRIQYRNELLVGVFLDLSETGR